MAIDHRSNTFIHPCMHDHPFIPERKRTSRGPLPVVGATRRVHGVRAVHGPCGSNAASILYYRGRPRGRQAPEPVSRWIPR